MPFITKDLIRKRSEHNEGVIATLEEISLHQEELEGISEFLGNNCRKLKILYLQNNIIRKMENLRYLRDLEYLNMALNNVSRIQGLQNCEFLKKLDLTLNFVDFDELELSMTNLQRNLALRELYMMGNPSHSKWNGEPPAEDPATVTPGAPKQEVVKGENKFQTYVIAKLPQLERIDGIEITKSMQIVARQRLPILEKELKALAEEVRAEKMAAAVAKGEAMEDLDEAIEVADETEEGREERERTELTDNTPEAREEIYREMAEQKKDKADKEKANQPKERDYEKEHAAKREEIRRKEEESGEVEARQKNEGGWSFRWDEESRRGFVLLEVSLSRHLDSSLIDVDVHPSYISIVIKSKLLRLRLPAEVRSEEAKCQRSKVTGSLTVVMPKLNTKENAISMRADQRAKDREKEKEKEKEVPRAKPKSGSASGGGRTTYKGKSGPSLQELMMMEAQGTSTGTGAGTGAGDGGGDGGETAGTEASKGSVFTSIDSASGGAAAKPIVKSFEKLEIGGAGGGGVSSGNPPVDGGIDSLMKSIVKPSPAERARRAAEAAADKAAEEAALAAAGGGRGEGVVPVIEVVEADDSGAFVL